MKRYVLGVDGGGTKTKAVIADEEGHVHGLGIGGPSNYDDVGMEKAKVGIAEALWMAGVVSEKDRAVIHAIARELSLAADGNIDIDHDCRIALAGGLSGRPGIVLIAGTGSSCYG